MDAPKLSMDAPLPDDVATLQAMVRDLLTEVARLRAENAELHGKLDAALKHRFGRRSERQLTSDAKKNKAGRARPHGRAALPESLERRQVVHDLTEAKKLCPCCGRPRVCIGEQTAEQLDLEPAHFFVLRTVKKSYACRHCDPEQGRPSNACRQRVQPKRGRWRVRCAAPVYWRMPSPPSSLIICRCFDWLGN
jgi:transposase